jgi:CDP-diacylglycerol--serine O-phosphatidyltransferase
MNKRLIPNAVTMVNLALGFLSLFLISEGMYTEAAYAIFGAMIMDGMDGRIARRLKATSDFGKELDSLSDLVSFGVAPALLAYSVQLHDWSYIGLPIAIIFALCGAYRLARFNVLMIKTHFIGVPITFCGPFLTLLLLLSKWLPKISYPIITLILAYLMVSNIKVRKL